MVLSTSVRHLVPDDAEDIAALEVDLFPDNCFNERTIRGEIEAGEGWCLRLFHGELIGYAMTRRNERLVDLTRIGVREHYRSRKHGSMLLEEVLAVAYHRGDDLILCVRKDNDLAIRWYLRRDFKVVGELGHSWVMRHYILRDENVRPQPHL